MTRWTHTEIEIFLAMCFVAMKALARWAKLD
jgi:hypothetical protein